jgi:hypothetical protein
MNARNVTCLSLFLVFVLGLSSCGVNCLVVAPSVEWQKSYGALEGNSVIQASDGGYLVGGEVKTDPSGNIQWNKTYGASLNFPFLLISSVISTKDGGYAFLAASSLVKTDSSGDIEWSINVANYLGAYCVLQTNDGGYVLVGGLGTIDLYHPFGILTACLFKLNSTGGVEWSKTYEEEEFFDAVVTDSGYALIGKSRSTSDNYLHVTDNYFLITTDSDGNLISQKNWNQNALQSIEKTDDGLLIIGPGNTIIKTDQNGNETWTYTYQRPDLDNWVIFNSVSATNDGDCVILGTASLAQNVSVIVKLGSNGALLWDKTFNETSTIQPGNIISTSDGGIAFTYSNGDVTLTKLKPAESTLSPTQTENAKTPQYTIIGVALSAIIILAIAVTVAAKFIHKKRKK